MSTFHSENECRHVSILRKFGYLFRVAYYSAMGEDELSDKGCIKIVQCNWNKRLSKQNKTRIALSVANLSHTEI